MPTIKFTEDQYNCLLEVLAYNQQDEERDVCEKYPALDEMDFCKKSSYLEQLKMLKKVGAEDHIYYARCVAYLAIDGVDDTESVEEENETCSKCNEAFTYDDNFHKGFNREVGGDRMCEKCFDEEDE
jgi:hypothetical protein